MNKTRALLAAVAVGAALMGGTATAKASPEQDQAFYDAMYGAGIIIYPAAYSQARRACGVMWSGQATPDTVVDIVWDANPDWNYSQAQAFVAATIAIYCPPVARGGQLS